MSASKIVVDTIPQCTQRVRPRERIYGIFCATHVAKGAPICKTTSLTCLHHEYEEVLNTRGYTNTKFFFSGPKGIRAFRNRLPPHQKIYISGADLFFMNVRTCALRLHPHDTEFRVYSMVCHALPCSLWILCNAFPYLAAVSGGKDLYHFVQCLILLLHRFCNEHLQIGWWSLSNYG